MKMQEKQLQVSWNRIIPGTKFCAVETEEEITVISPGTWNLEAGPDFLNAKILFEGKELTGDVEIHRGRSDWNSHGHHKDNNYKNVILHVVAKDNITAGHKASYVLSIPVIEIQPNKSSSDFSDSDRFPNGKCASFFSSLGNEKLYSFFRSAGLKRFNMKTEDILKEMLKNGAEATCSKLIFEACGYKKNRQNFIELFRRFSEHENIKSFELQEATLWGESGLLPDISTSLLDSEMKTYTKKCWKLWWSARISTRTDIPWIYSGVRPLNSPERRIAALNIIFSRLGRTPLAFLSGKAKKIGSPERFLTLINKTFYCSHSLWDNYSSFYKKRQKPAAVLSSSRILDLAVNVILPSLNASAIIRKDKILSKLIKDTWLLVPATQTNRTVNIAVHRWFMPPETSENILIDAASCQGALHVYKNFCEKCHTDCENCLIGSLDPERELGGGQADKGE